MSNETMIMRDDRLMAYHGPGGDVIIPDGVTAIGEEVFAECDLPAPAGAPAPFLPH